MLVTRLFPLCLILALASSAPGTYYHPYGYPDIQSPVSFGPNLFYGSAPGLTGESSGFNGFSYFTKDFGGGGGESEVVFFTGPNSDAKMTKEVAAVKDQLSSLPSSTTADTKSDKVATKSDKVETKSDKVQEITPDSTASQDAAIVALPVKVETKEVAEQKEATSKTAESKTEDKKASDAISGIIDARFLLEQGSGFAAPYPILRLGGDASPYFPHQLSTSYSGFGGYEPSDYFRSQYVPVYNHYNSYQSLYNPLYPSLDTDYYNLDGFPSFYQSPIIGSSSSFSPVSNLISSKPEKGVITSDGITAPKIDQRLGDVENATGRSSEKKIDEVSSTSDKATELPTTTQQTDDKSTTVSETVPTTTVDNEIKEAATTVVSDAVAAP